MAREDIALLHAICRRLDDTVDEAASTEAASDGLARWAAEIDGRSPPRPLVAAFLAGTARTGLPLQCLHALLEGMRSDLRTVRIADDTELLRYCYRVSATVGLMVSPLLDLRDHRAAPFAIDLGIALQLTNILMGVEEDAARNRIYLPASRLAARGITAESVLTPGRTPTLRAVLGEVAGLANRYYRSAELGARYVPWRYRHGLLLLGRLYGGLGQRASRRVGISLAGVSPPERALRLAQVFLLAGTPGILGVGPQPVHDAALHRAIAGWPGTAGHPLPRAFDR